MRVLTVRHVLKVIGSWRFAAGMALLLSTTKYLL